MAIHKIETTCKHYLPDRSKRKVRRRLRDGVVTACPDCGALWLATSETHGSFDYSWTYHTWTEVASIGQGS